MSLLNTLSNFSSKNFSKQNSQNSVYSINKKDQQDNSLTIIRKIYPKFSEDYTYEENNVTNNEDTLTIKNDLIFKRNKPSFLFDDEENNNSLSEVFLQNLIKRPCPLNKSKIISVISKFIQNTSLIQKIQKEIQSNKKFNINELSIMCAEILNYIELKKGKVLFRIGDIGDRFYFILSGKICILKLKELKNIQLNYYEYIDYLMFLIKKKENYIFNEVIKKNENILRINTELEVKSIYKVLVLRKLKQKIIHQSISNIDSLNTYIEKLGCKLEDFDIQIDELEQIENNKLLKNKEREWNNYLLKKCKPAFSDLLVFEPYESKFINEEKHSIICYCYEPFLFLGKGLFFGDFALDSEINKRNATIRAEEDTILGFLKSVDYVNIFAPKRKLEKLKEIAFLYNNYFFGNINSRVFEKNYFHLFSPHEYLRNNILFIFGSNQKSLIFLKEGKVSLELKSSIIDLHNLIKYLWDNIYSNKWYKLLNKYQKNELIPSHIENKIKEYINEPIFISLKVYGEQFTNEMNKVKNYQISMLTNNEIIGLEEIYLNIPYIMKGTVVDNKINCYEITKEHINKFLSEEKQILFPFVKASVNKIISLIERLQNFKINGINMIKTKFEKDYFDFIKIHEDENQLNYNNNYNKINEIETEKERISNKNRIRNNNLNKNQSKTLNKIILNDKNNIEKKLLLNKIKNNGYKSPFRLFSTNLIPAINLIKSKQQKINKKDYNFTPNNKININIIKPLSKEELHINENNFSKNDSEINNKSMDNKIENKANNNSENKNNISNSTSTDIMPTSSENNINSSNRKINNNKTINELKKELKKINVIEFENNEIINLNNGYNNISKRSYSFNDLLKNDELKKIKDIKKRHYSKLGIFNLSYVPLNILSPKGRLLQRSHSSIFKNNNSISKIIKPYSNKKKIFSFCNLYIKKINKKELEEKNEKDNNEKEKINNIWYGIKTNGIKNINNININKELSKYFIKQELNHNENIYKKEKIYNLINDNKIKKSLSPDVIKNYYKEIKKRGYSSFIHNKEYNTIFNRKYKRKYGKSSSQIITPKNNIDSKKNSSLLPIINEKSNIFLSDKGM